MHSTVISSLRARLALLLVAVACLFSATGIAAAQPVDDRIESVIATAIELSRQGENEAWFDIYDRLHPDVRNQLPREAFLGWARSGELGVPVDDPAIGDVSFTEWVWEPTGDAYDEVAIVPYTQQVILNGVEVTAEGEWTFVHDGQRWRWLPDLTAADIDGLVIAADEAPVTYEPGFRQASYARIDRFWENVFTEAGREYEPVAGIVAVTETPLETGCGLEDDIAALDIYYCTGDATIYYDPTFRDLVVDHTGPYGWTMIISHEWGHHVQALLDVRVAWDPELDEGLYPIEVELLADCLAGIYAQDAVALGLIDDDEVDSAEEITSLAGDAPGTSWDDFTAHGTSEQRVDAFYTGFEDGFTGCHLDLTGEAA